jgi:hypothetical protein
MLIAAVANRTAWGVRMTATFRTKSLGQVPAVTLDGTNELLTISVGTTTSNDSLEIAMTSGNLPGLDHLAAAAPPDRVTVTLKKASATSANVVLQGKQPGTASLIFASPADCSCVLTVGTHGSHLGSDSVDLLAAASNGGDARKVVGIQQILHNEGTCIIDQLTGPFGSQSMLACGDVAMNAAKALFGDVSVSYFSYHVPISSKATSVDWSDIKYTEATTRKAVHAIQTLLNRGTAARVGLVHHPSKAMLASSGALQPTSSGGHFGLIVGVSKDGNRFLYLDPWPSGSRTKYKGGMSFNANKVCNYLGVFELNSDRGLHLRSVVEPGNPGVLGAMEVIAGPL